MTVSGYTHTDMHTVQHDVTTDQFASAIVSWSAGGFIRSIALK